jgi:hypothetical protein
MVLEQLKNNPVPNPAYEGRYLKKKYLYADFPGVFT